MKRASKWLGAGLAMALVVMAAADSARIYADTEIVFVDIYRHAPAPNGEILLPNPEVTPGLVRTISSPGSSNRGPGRPLTAAQVCAVKWGLDRRHVTAAMKRRVCAAYGIPAVDCNGRKYEIDHLIPRELGGADDVRNLFPQPLAQARLKDRLENWLHRQVCSANVSLPDAQKVIAADWFTTYQDMMRRRP